MLAELDREELVYSGRVDFHDPKHPEWVFPATALRFRFYGKRASLWVTNRRDYWKNTLGAVVDGAQLRFDLNNARETELRLIDEAADGEHDVLVFKRMDGCHEVVLERLELSEGSRLLPAPARPARRMEVYGDSVSAGELSEAVHRTGMTDPTHDGEFSNSWYSYAWMTARRLGAELHDIAQGGIALLDGTGWFREPNAVGMESVWNTVHYSPAFGVCTPWDFSRWTPQVVIVAIGQNDSHPSDYMAENPNGEQAARWRGAYRDFLGKLRETYPKARIICCTTLLEHNAAWDDAIGRVCREMHDAGISQYRFRRNGRGTPGHLRIPEAEEMAAELSAYIESLHIGGWDS